ncbi:MAG: PEP-CTERM sorting domain-containing protein [Planctomycetota bacterium]|nr:PEP-CTERM sorting domain-containing protein [Planctomycetota bacterium]
MMNTFTCITATTAFVAIASANASVNTLTFEGVGDQNAVGNFYNGGAGTDYGVEFIGNTLGLVASSAGGQGNFTNAPSMPTVMFWQAGEATTMNVAAGFESGFATYYSSIDTAGSISIWSGLDGTGSILATLNLIGLGTDNTPNAAYDRWALVGAAFVGTAHSVTFTGAADQIAFDDVTFGSAIPAPGALALLAAAGCSTRRRRA